MGKYGFGFLLLLVLVAAAACEKDDICVEGDTPLLVVEFYDVEDTSALKAVPKLRVAGVGKTVTVNTVADRTDLNRISIPLRVNRDSTSFVLISNSATNDAGEETGTLDTVHFSYVLVDTMISRACGFIVNYKELEAALEGPNGQWIERIEVIRPLVKNSDSTHVKIFH
ncbi:DUF6452 family protein [Maribacter sp. 2307ULW6-5]|uniref:DUF6452 family protein n=1 Tax=Maribacter sp. 2307ULW6-5 TaxID=3386275 RepID=UPI0039BC2803